jgi:3-methyladenine DNA glycosylase AlkD
MSTVNEVMAELASLEDPKLRKFNEARGDEFGVNLSALRAVAKGLKTQHELAQELWGTGDTTARLLATLITRPKLFTADELDAMVHDVRGPKLLDWFITNVMKQVKDTEALRLRWKDAPDLVGRAGWSLTVDRVVKQPDEVDLDALLDQIEAEMKDAAEPKQWSMNYCLVEIGIRHPALRARANAIGEKLQVYIDFPASPGCLPPYAPIWIAEMVRRQEAVA